MAAPHPPAKGQSSVLRYLCISSQSSEREEKERFFPSSKQKKNHKFTSFSCCLGLLWGLTISISFQEVSPRNRGLFLHFLQQLPLVGNLKTPMLTYPQGLFPNFSSQIFKKDPVRAIKETKRFQIHCFWVFPPMLSRSSCFLTKSSMLSSMANEAPSAEQLSWLDVQFPSASEK